MKTKPNTNNPILSPTDLENEDKLNKIAQQIRKLARKNFLKDGAKRKLISYYYKLMGMKQMTKITSNYDSSNFRYFRKP